MANGLLAKNGIIVTGSVEVQNAVTASAFSGDGSGLVGVSDFPYTGSAAISGSLEIIGPITAINKPNGTTIDITNTTTSNHGGEGVYIGYNAAPNNTLSRNTVIGKDAAANSTTMYDSVVIGANAGESVSSGMRSSVTIGTFTGMSTNGLGNSVTIGTLAGRYTDGTNNVFLGHSAGYWYEGGSSILIGRNAGYSANGQADGSNNAYIGYSAGQNFQGDTNIALGHRVGLNASGSNNILIGYEAGYNHVGNDMLIISNTGSKALITGDFANNTLDISGSVSASTYYGDGSNLTGISSDPFPYTGSAVITGSNSLAGSYALKVTNTSGADILNVENNGAVTIGDTNSKLTVDGNISKFGNAFKIDQSIGTRYLYLTNFHIIDTIYPLNIQAVGISLSSNTINLGGGFGKTININKGGSSETSIPNDNGVEMLFKPQAQGHIPQYSILRGTDTGFQPVPLYIFGGANTNTTYASAQTGSVILQYIPNVGARGNVGIGLEDPQTNLHVSGAVSASTYYGENINVKNIEINGSGSTLFEVNGSSGQLFSITDSLSGSLFAVSDVSGLPILEVFSDDTIKMGSFNAEALEISGSDVNFNNLPTSDPGVAGRLYQTGSDAIGATAGFQVVCISQG